MAISKYGVGLTYGGTDCLVPVYGVSSSINTANVSGNITNIQEWVGQINLTGDVFIQNGAAVVIDCDAVIDSNSFTIIIQDGGYLNTRNKRLPHNSSIGSILIIS